MQRAVELEVGIDCWNPGCADDGGLGRARRDGIWVVGFMASGWGDTGFRAEARTHGLAGCSAGQRCLWAVLLEGDGYGGFGCGYNLILVG